MTKTAKKTKKPAAKKAARKPAKRLSAKSAKPVQRAKKSATPKHHGRNTKKAGTNVIWKFLEMKENRRREFAEQNAGQHSRNHGGQYGHGTQGYVRFAGPRRKAA